MFGGTRAMILRIIWEKFLPKMTETINNPPQNPYEPKDEPEPKTPESTEETNESGRESEGENGEDEPEDSSLDLPKGKSLYTRTTTRIYALRSPPTVVGVHGHQTQSTSRGHAHIGGRLGAHSVSGPTPFSL